MTKHEAAREMRRRTREDAETDRAYDLGREAWLQGGSNPYEAQSYLWWVWDFGYIEEMEGRAS